MKKDTSSRSRHCSAAAPPRNEQQTTRRYGAKCLLAPKNISLGIRLINKLRRRWFDLSGGDLAYEVRDLGIDTPIEEMFTPNGRRRMQAMMYRSEAISVWMSLSEHLIAWAIAATHEVDRVSDQANRIGPATSRDVLGRCFFMGGLSTSWKDISLVAMPQTIWKEARESLMALDYGELPSMFTPKCPFGKLLSRLNRL